MIAASLPLFKFEADYAATLCCMPMIVRFHLDACRLKLTLADWQRFDLATRKSLILLPTSNPTELKHYRRILLRTSGQQLLRPLGRLPPSRTAPPWRGDVLPERILRALRDRGLLLDGPQHWSELAPLQRFALFKLTRPGHENRNFLLALREFGLMAS